LRAPTFTTLQISREVEISPSPPQLSVRSADVPPSHGDGRRRLTLQSDSHHRASLVSTRRRPSFSLLVPIARLAGIVFRNPDDPYTMEDLGEPLLAVGDTAEGRDQQGKPA
jgi:hypothetical protein